MSYDLYFWRQDAENDLPPGAVLDSMSESEPTPGVVALPMHLVHQRLREEFPDIAINGPEFEWEGCVSYFQGILTMASDDSACCASVSCGYQLLDSPDTVNQLIAVFNSLGCALYDPQAGERYEQPDLR